VRNKIRIVLVQAYEKIKKGEHPIFSTVENLKTTDIISPD